MSLRLPFESVESLDAEQAQLQKELSQRQRTFNGLTAKEWTLLSRNVWNDLSSPRHERHLEHGAVFPVKLAARLITILSAPGDLVLDPFAGIGSTLIAALQEGRESIGIELSQRFVDLADAWIDEEKETIRSELAARLVCDDVRNLRSHLAPESVALTVTSPPYADFIRRSINDRKKTHKKSRLVYENNSRVKTYSDDPRDFGNLSYDDFLVSCQVVLSDLLHVTREEGYAAWVVKDYRLPPERPYVPFHSDFASVAQEAGWLWHDLIVWDQNDQRSLVLLGYPSRFYSNQNCSFIVILRKAA